VRIKHHQETTIILLHMLRRALNKATNLGFKISTSQWITENSLL
jgi:hypothetical protein